MKLNQLTKNSTLTEEEFTALVEVKGVEVPFRVLKTTSISTRGTSYTAVSIKRAHAGYGNLPNLTKGQKEKIRKLIEDEINKIKEL
jgi:hypothetical protein